MATFTVTTTADSGAGSLRQAILDANATSGADTIDFSIGSGDLKTISPTSALPLISDAVTIDGTTQPGYAGTPIIELNGTNAGTQASGLSITAPNTTVRGLVVNRFQGHGILLANAGRDTIEANFIGTDPTGTIALGNGGSGVVLANARGNTIGGPTAAARNVIDSNNGYGVALLDGSTNNVVVGNFIGTDASGVLPSGNNAGGLYIENSRDNRIGGTTSGEGDVISGNGSSGITIASFSRSSEGTRIEGNLIGLGADGSPLANAGNGISFLNTSFSSVGGITPAGAGNVIANNGGSGVLVSGGAGVSLLSNSIASNRGPGITLFTFPAGLATPNLRQAYTSGGGVHVDGTLTGAPQTTYTVQFFSNVAADPSGSGEGQTLIATVPVTTDSGGTATISQDIPAAVSQGQFITATATTPEGSTSAFSRAVRVEAGPTADVSVSLVASPNPVVVGNTLTYTLTIANNGPADATGVMLKDTLPAGVTFVSALSAKGACTFADGVVTCNLGTLAAAGQAVVTVQVIPTVQGIITDTASVSASEIDTNVRNNTASADTTVVPATFDLAVSGNDIPDPVRVGTELTYTLNVFNRGPDAAPGVRLTSNLPDGVDFVSATSPGGKCTFAGGVVTCDFGTLDPFSVTPVTIVVRPRQEGNLSLTASVTGLGNDLNPRNNQVTILTTAVPTRFDLAIAAAAIPNPVISGNPLTYVVTVVNGGPDAAPGVTLTDTLPPGAEFVSATSPLGTCVRGRGRDVRLRHARPGRLGHRGHRRPAPGPRPRPDDDSDPHRHGQRHGVLGRGHRPAR